MRRSLLGEFTVDLSHDEAGRVETALRHAGAAVLGTTYDARFALQVGLPPADEARLRTLVAELTGGAGRVTAVGERWVDATDSSGR